MNYALQRERHPVEHPLAFLEGYDPTYQLVCFGAWSHWEEVGWFIICEKEGKYYYQSGGCSVMDVYRHHYEQWNPEPITVEEALQEMIDWESQGNEVEFMD